MNKSVLLKTNIFICLIIVTGFLVTSLISYHSNKGIMLKDVENISSLTSEGVFYEIDSVLSKPVNISTTMANDSLLIDLLKNELNNLDNEEYTNQIKNYLNTYKEKYNYDSVFLISTETARYYHFKGIDRIINPDNDENIWYYDFLKSEEEFSLNIDNDEASNHEITVFVNCKIFDENKNVIGVVGVGFKVNEIQDKFKYYNDMFDISVYLIDSNGKIEISASDTGYSNVNFFEYADFLNIKDKILIENAKMQKNWYRNKESSSFIVNQYIPTLNWYLIIHNDITNLEKEIRFQLIESIIVIIFVIISILFVITTIIKKYDILIRKLTKEREAKYDAVFKNETKKLYENIYELDITNNKAASEATVKYFTELGVDKNSTFNEVLKIIAEKEIKEEFRQGYIDTFSTENVLKAYNEGKDCLQYDCMTTNDNGQNYYWIRIIARIFCWEEDNSVHMFTYRQNVDAEKQQEKNMLDKMNKDPMTKLYNKSATQKEIEKRLAHNKDKSFAFFILDIDNFKNVNDTCGHIAGDLAIEKFANILKSNFNKNDIIGRIGGDEFVAFSEIESEDYIEIKAKKLIKELNIKLTEENKSCAISASIGISIIKGGKGDFITAYKNADIALYISKKNGKNGFTVFNDKFIK